MLVLVTVTAGTVSYAAAATLGTASGPLGTGGVAVLPCDADGFAYTRQLDASRRITAVTISGINPACAGGTLQLTLTNASNAAIGTGSGAVNSSGVLTVVISGAPLAADVTAYRSAITD